MEYGVVYRLYPSEEQEELINKTMGCVRAVYNHFLKGRDLISYVYGETLNYSACCRILARDKKKERYAFLREVDSSALQRTLKHLDNAFQAYYSGRCGYPRFKSKNAKKQSYTSTNRNNCIRIEGNRIRLPKLGWIHIKNDARPEGRILSATVKKHPTGKYTVSVTYTDVEKETLPPTDKTVGLDVGVTNTVTTSDGEIFQIPKKIYKIYNTIQKMQHALSRKQKGSNNYEKQRKDINRKYEDIHNITNDYYNKLTTELIQENQVIVIETLKIQNMLKNPRLSKHIQRQCWNTFFNKLKYKAEWYGRKIIEVSMWYPSTQLCNNCNYQNTKLTLNDRTWTCPECNTTHDRDINAAKNLQREGNRLYKELLNRGGHGDSLCYYEVETSSKQETHRIKQDPKMNIQDEIIYL